MSRECRTDISGRGTGILACMIEFRRQARTPALLPSRESRNAVPSCTLALKAIPNAPRNEIVGWLGDALKVKVHAPALQGRANVELCAFLADQLGVPHRAVKIAGGKKSRQKRVSIDGFTLAEVRLRLTARFPA